MDTLFSLGLAVLFTGLLETILHIWEWNKAPGHELTPPWTYVVGLLPILLAYSGWMLYQGSSQWWEAVFGLLVIVGAGGLTVIGLYLHDNDKGRRLERDVLGRGANGNRPKFDA